MTKLLNFISSRSQVSPRVEAREPLAWAPARKAECALDDDEADVRSAEDALPRPLVRRDSEAGEIRDALQRQDDAGADTGRPGCSAVWARMAADPEVPSATEEGRGEEEEATNSGAGARQRQVEVSVQAREHIPSQVSERERVKRTNKRTNVRMD